MTGETWPALGTSPAKTVTYPYSVATKPLEASVETGRYRQIFVTTRGRLSAVVHVRRVRCGRCGTSEVLLPDFVFRRDLNSTTAVGTAMLTPSGTPQ
jgi:hypothetical protein